MATKRTWRLVATQSKLWAFTAEPRDVPEADPPSWPEGWIPVQEHAELLERAFDLPSGPRKGMRAHYVLWCRACGACAWIALTPKDKYGSDRHDEAQRVVGARLCVRQGPAGVLWSFADALLGLLAMRDVLPPKAAANVPRSWWQGGDAQRAVRAAWATCREPSAMVRLLNALWYCQHPDALGIEHPEGPDDILATYQSEPSHTPGRSFEWECKVQWFRHDGDVVMWLRGADRYVADEMRLLLPDITATAEWRTALGSCDAASNAP